jgi:hypothetical protein
LKVHGWDVITRHGWGTVPLQNNVGGIVFPHPTSNMIFLDIHGGPLDSQRMPFVASTNRMRPTTAMIQDVMVDGIRAIYVFNPVNDRWECRYEENVAAHA